MKAVLIEDENGQIVAYTRRGTFRDIDHAVQVLKDIDKINEYECMKLTRDNEDGLNISLKGRSKNDKK